MQRIKEKLITKFNISIIFVVLISILCLIFFLNKNSNYMVKINLIDDDSPDRILEVYKNDNKIEYKEIRLKDITLCTYDNPAVYYGELVDIEEVTIILKNGDSVKAKIFKEEV